MKGKCGAAGAASGKRADARRTRAEPFLPQSLRHQHGVGAFTVPGAGAASRNAHNCVTLCPLATIFLGTLGYPPLEFARNMYKNERNGTNDINKWIAPGE
eukprot:gene25245-biopygen5990